MTMLRVLTALVVAVTVLAAAAGVAGADCAGPTIEHDVGSVDRDDTIRVVGTTWGDACYDTGRPPPGESAFGKPVTDIEVYLVQGGVEHLVATGDADDELGFTVDLPVPDDMASGPVDVVVRSPLDVHTYDVTPEPLAVSDRPPTGTSDDAPVRFVGSEVARESSPARAPATAAPTSPAPSSDADEAGSGVPAAVVGAGLLAAGAAAAVALHRIRRRRA